MGTVDQFTKIRMEQPKSGDVLTTLDNRDIVLTVTESGGKKAVFCKVVVDVDRSGWFLSQGEKGMTCMVMPHAQNELRRDLQGRPVVQRLRAVRYSGSGRALLCEVDR